MTLSQQADSITSDSAQSKDNDVELHLLHRESFGVPLDVASSRFSEDPPDIASRTEYEVLEPGNGTQVSTGRTPAHPQINTDFRQETCHQQLNSQAPRNEDSRPMR